MAVIIVDGLLFHDQPQEKIETDNIVKEKFQARLNQHIASKQGTFAESYYFSQAEISRGTSNKYTREEIEIAKWIVQQEANGSTFEHKLIVAQVLLNRLNDGYWGNTLSDVIFATGQFPSKSNWYNKKNIPDEDTIKAVKSTFIKEREDISQGAMYFYNPKYVTDQSTINWFESMEFLFEIDGHRFFK